MTRKRVSNNNIHGPRGARLTLQNIDFQRIQEMGLGVKVVFYTSANSVGGSFTARYQGVVYAKERPSLLSEISLPNPSYHWFIATKHQKKVENEGFTPADTLVSHPNNLEFIISAEKPEEYRGIIAFRDIIIPELFKHGYDKPNSNHTSEFWFHAGKPSSETLPHLLSIGPYRGLEVSAQKAEGITVFTYMDVRKLMGLRMPK